MDKDHRAADRSRPSPPPRRLRCPPSATPTPASSPHLFRRPPAQASFVALSAGAPAQRSALIRVNWWPAQRRRQAKAIKLTDQESRPASSRPRRARCIPPLSTRWRVRLPPRRHRAAQRLIAAPALQALGDGLRRASRAGVAAFNQLPQAAKIGAGHMRLRAARARPASPDVPAPPIPVQGTANYQIRQRTWHRLAGLRLLGKIESSYRLEVLQYQRFALTMTATRHPHPRTARAWLLQCDRAAWSPARDSTRLARWQDEELFVAVRAAKVSSSSASSTVSLCCSWNGWGGGATAAVALRRARLASTLYRMSASWQLHVSARVEAVAAAWRQRRPHRGGGGCRPRLGAAKGSPASCTGFICAAGR